jgi:hypothetical protein
MGSPLPIQVSEIESVLNLMNEWDRGERLRTLDLIGMMDDVFLKHVSKAAELNPKTGASRT